MSHVKVHETPDSLRDYLDGLDDAGVGYSTVGLDAEGEPFIIWLAGCYAETEIVLSVWPWDLEVEVREAVHCDECGSQRKDLGMDSLRFPVTVLETQCVGGCESQSTDQETDEESAALVDRNLRAMGSEGLQSTGQESRP